MPLGTVITRLRLSPGTASTTDAVITLVMEPIGRSVSGDRDHRLAPVTAFASSAWRDRTAAGADGLAALTDRMGSAPVAALAGIVAAMDGNAAIPAATISPATTAPPASRRAIRTRPPPAPR